MVGLTTCIVKDRSKVGDGLKRESDGGNSVRFSVTIAVVAVCVVVVGGNFMIAIVDVGLSYIFVVISAPAGIVVIIVTDTVAVDVARQHWRCRNDTSSI